MSTLRQIFTALFSPKPSAVVEPTRNMLIPVVGYHTLKESVRVLLSGYVRSGLLRCVLLLPNLDATVRTAVERSLCRTGFEELHNAPPEFLSGITIATYLGSRATGGRLRRYGPTYTSRGLFEIYIPYTLQLVTGPVSPSIPIPIRSPVVAFRTPTVIDLPEDPFAQHAPSFFRASVGSSVASVCSSDYWPSAFFAPDYEQVSDSNTDWTSVVLSKARFPFKVFDPATFYPRNLSSKRPAVGQDYACIPIDRFGPGLSDVYGAGGRPACADIAMVPDEAAATELLEEPSWFRGLVDDDDLAADMEPETALVSGSMTYTLRGILGQGGQGRVLLAADDCDELVAIKVVHKHSASRWDGGHELLLQEMDIMRNATLEGRQFLAGLLESFDDADNVYFVMRLYPETLWHRIYRNPAPLGERDSLLYCAELVVALAQLHNMRTVHRDIKLENIYIGPQGRLVLADFGLACVSHDYSLPFDHFEMSGSWGTPGYYAPEMLEKEETGSYTCQADIFSMGMVFYEILTGQQVGGTYWEAVNSEEQQQQMDRKPLDLTDLVEDAVARDLLYGMLNKDPSRRFALDQIMWHPFFDGIDFRDVERRLYRHEYKPEFPCRALKPNKSIKYGSFIGTPLCVVELEAFSHRWRLGEFAWECPPGLRVDPVHGGCYMPLVDASEPDSSSWDEPAPFVWA